VLTWGINLGLVFEVQDVICASSREAIENRCSVEFDHPRIHSHKVLG
jgi:hypothetical protein